MADFKTWFENIYIDWLTQRRKRGSVREFSDLLDIDQKMVANWMRGSGKPGPQYADKIAKFLDYDLTVYDLLGLPKPDKRLLKAKANWEYMTEAERDEITHILERAEARHAQEEAKHPIPNP